MIVIDSAGLYTGLRNEKKPSPTGERGRLATWILLRQTLAALECAVYWVNSDHELADAMTKLSNKCPNAHKNLHNFLRTGTFRISYDSQSARRCHQQRLSEPPLDEEEVDPCSTAQNKSVRSYKDLKTRLHENRWRAWEFPE